MIVHLGGDHLINEEDIIGFFDIDTSTVTKNTRDFLYMAEKNSLVINVSYELPKSFILHKCGKVFVSQISTATLKSRCEFLTVIEPFNILK